MNYGTCIHFNGIQNAKCKAGLPYPAGPIPCIKVIHKTANGGTYFLPGELPAKSEPFSGAAKALPCPLYLEPTDEQIQAHRVEQEADMNNAIVAMTVAGKWRVRPKPAQDRSEVVECPICKGRLHLSQSAYNGHVHGKCETADCVSWME